MKISIYALLILPKIPITSNAGILIGELLLLVTIPFNFLRKIRINSEFVVLLLFLTYTYTISSLLSGIFLDIFPLESILFFFRVLIYSELFIFFSNLKVKNLNQIYIDYFYKPYILNFSLSFIIFLTEFIIKKPSIMDMLWGYQVGFRLIPITGLSLDIFSENILPLSVIGGGSANMIFAFSLINLLISFYLNKAKFHLVFIIAMIYTFLSMTRGGTLTLFIFIFYVLVSKKAKLKDKIRIILMFILLLVIILTLIEFMNFPNIFDRIFNTLDNGTLDASSMGRIKNYKDFFYSWISNFRYIIFGMGNDSSLYLQINGHSLIESYYLQVLFGSGLIGIIILLYYFYIVYKKSHFNKSYKILFTYLLIQSIINWSITGGDFLSPINLFILFSIMGIKNNYKIRSD